jgi:hypothetical protein
MEFDKNHSNFSISVYAGYLFSYFIFTTVLYFILTLLNKIPCEWTYFHVMIITISLIIISKILGKILE